MPSPTSSTLPTSDRSTLLRYCRISSVITEVISSTLNLMPAPRAYVACVTRASIQPVHSFFLVTTASRRPRSTNRARRCDSRGLLKASIGSPPHPLDPLPTLRGEGDAPSLPLARIFSLVRCNKATDPAYGDRTRARGGPGSSRVRRGDPPDAQSRNDRSVRRHLASRLRRGRPHRPGRGSGLRPRVTAGVLEGAARRAVAVPAEGQSGVRLLHRGQALRRSAERSLAGGDRPRARQGARIPDPLRGRRHRRLSRAGGARQGADGAQPARAPRGGAVQT